MTTVTDSRRFDLLGIDNAGKTCLFPREYTNQQFADMCDFRTKTIYKDPSKYCAFPYTEKLGGTLITIFSVGDVHGDSDRQFIMTSSNNGYTYTEPSVFFENSTGFFDFSALDGLMATGDKITLKVWTITKTVTGYTVTVNSIITHSGLDYAIWSKPKLFSDGNLYRTGYAVNGSDIQTALFKSTDGGDNYVFVTILFSGSGLLFSEADVEEYSPNNIVAICREDTPDSNNNMYKNYSNDLGVSFLGQELIPVVDINGRQPNLFKLASGDILLGTGDRNGISGISPSGNVNISPNYTGITIWKSSNGFVDYSFRTAIAHMYSTDGGQPYIQETSVDRICVTYYAAKDIDSEPIIASSLLDTSFLVDAVDAVVIKSKKEVTQYTPTLYGAVLGTPVITEASGMGIRNGDSVRVTGKIAWSSLGGTTGQMYIGNLPWRNNFDNNDGSFTPKLVLTDLLYTSTGAGIRAYLSADTNILTISNESGATNLNSSTNASITETGSLEFSVTYSTKDTESINI